MRPGDMKSTLRRWYALLAAVLAFVSLIALSVTLTPAPVVAEPQVEIPRSQDPYPTPPEMAHVDLSRQTDAEAAAKSQGCLHCHQNVHEPHGKATVRLGCVDCHGGDASTLEISHAHVAPRFPGAWQTSANPVRSYTLLNHESPEFIRFVNPGDLRIAHISCGTSGCHPKEVLQNKKSMMTHGCMLWGAALYNNGAVPNKRPRYGESYSMNGAPQRLQTVPPPTEEEMRTKGVLPFLDPLPQFEITQPGNVLRIFERGGRFRPEVGIPERLEEPGRPRAKLSNRGLGTENRTDPVFIGLQKTRLLDPTLNFLGTNDHPGDYRSSGCTSCHVIYANDRSPIHSGPYAKYGNRGYSFSNDPTIPKDKSGHPIEHRFTSAIPTSQCIICHIHPGTTVMNTYLGYMWWDLETEGEHMYPTEDKKLTSEQRAQARMSDPNDASQRGLWSDPEFLANITDLNDRMSKTQFADFHGHGWVYRAVFRKDRKGALLDAEGKPVQQVTPEVLRAAMAPASDKERQTGKDRPGLPVHYLDIHLEKGMHCVDCHFVQDVHGDTKLYGEVRAAIEIQCIDCHGTVGAVATLKTSGPASKGQGRDLKALRTPFGKRRFEYENGALYQNSMVEKDLRWEVVQTKDTINPASSHYSAKAALAKTVRREADGSLAWGELPKEGSQHCAHANQNMSCIACHSAWNASCYGCHLPQKANIKAPNLHNRGDVSRNYVSYDFQTLRDDVYMLARDGDVTGNRIGPARSSCAIHVGSYNQNRESIYVQQQTISGEGQSGIAFSTNVPHTVRGKDGTKQCTDCHVASTNDNNAIMAQLLMQGTNYLNFIGKYCWVAAGEHGLAAVAVTENEAPQAVIGSRLHQLAFPEEFAKHEKRGGRLEHFHEHPGKDFSDNFSKPFHKPNVLQVQLRGEYLYAACGKDGLRVFDVAFIDDKAFSERIVTAPVSPVGQRFFVPTADCVAVASPTTIAPDPTRSHRPENREQPIHALYGYIFALDRHEGLITVPAATLLDGNPMNNFLQREVTFNPDGILCGGRSITIVGAYAYITCDAGLVVVDLNDPKHPAIASVLGKEGLTEPHALQIQFRYGYVCDKEGIKVLDVTDLARPVLISKLELHDAHSIYLARTYAYVAAGSQGLVILNIERPEQPTIDQVFNADGCINDCHDVKLGITYVSEFAYLADGANGLRVVQLTSPDTPGNDGFSPRPTPKLVATFVMPKKGHVLSVSEGVDRDRAVDESGHQIAVFGRIGARPLNLAEQQKLYLHQGKVWTVSDDPADPMYKRVGGGATPTTRIPAAAAREKKSAPR